MIEPELKKKLTVEEQIIDLENKGIKFSSELCSKDDAKKYLGYNTYYFKLKAYENLYSNDNRDHKYQNLEFEYLRELSKLDMHLRKLIMAMCLDIEHIIKTRLIYDCSTNKKTDGYDFVTEFLNGNYLCKKGVLDIAKGTSISAELAKNYRTSNESDLKPIPIWTIVELLPFGRFIELYEYYYQKYKDRNHEYTRYLGAIKFLRNAAAHSNCLIYNLKKRQKFSPTREVMQTLSRAKNIQDSTRINQMQIPVIHDFVTLLFVYNDLLDNPYNARMKNKRMLEVNQLFRASDGRIKVHAEYFSDNMTLMNSYKFIVEVLKYLENESNKPKNKRNRLLKTN